MHQSSVASAPPRPRASLASERAKLPAYFLLAYAVSWLFWVPLALSQRGVLAWEVPPLFFWLGGIGPITAAVLLTWHSRGGRGLVELLAPLLRWRVHWGWYVVALFWPTAIAVLALALLSLAGVPLEVEVAAWAAILTSVVLATLLLTVEEVGWRGYALPRLQSGGSALRSTLILGVLWGLWHFPLHLMPSYPRPLPSPLLSIATFTAFAVLFSVLLTWIFNSTRGSLLLVLLAHQAFNTTNFRALSVQPGAPFQMAGFALLALLALGLVWRFGPDHLSRTKRVTLPSIHPGLASASDHPHRE